MNSANHNISSRMDFFSLAAFSEETRNKLIDDKKHSHHSPALRLNPSGAAPAAFRFSPIFELVVTALPPL